MTSWDDVASQIRPLEVTIRVPMRADLIDTLQLLEVELRQAAQRDKDGAATASLADRPKAPVVAERIQALERELADSEVEFKFRAIGRRAYDQLLAEHPPTAIQVKEAKAQGVVALYNLDTFPPALAAACCVQPAGATVEHLRKAYDEWSPGQWSVLWRAVIAVTQGSADVGPKSVTASAIRLASQLS